jgi:hypothetical protein
MPDWPTYVTEHLASLPNARSLDEEVVRELAGHLEERYEAFLAQGLVEEEAYQRTCTEVGEWIELRDGILSAKEGTMQNRVMQLWVPGLVTILGSAGLLAILEFTGFRPWVFRPGDPSSMVLYVPWLACLPIIGALGAFLSRRAQAPNLAIHLSSAFPAVVMGIVLLLVFVEALFLDRPVSLHIKTIGFFAAGLNWVILPGVALLLGDLLIQLFLRRRVEYR